MLPLHDTRRTPVITPSMLLAAALVIACAVAPNASIAASFAGLGDLAGGRFYSQAYGVSADGSTIVGVSRTAAGSEAFRWTSGAGMVGLGDLTGGIVSGFGLGVSADGSIVVGRGNGESGAEAFRWSDEEGMVGLGNLNGGSIFSFAAGVSADGSIVVGGAQGGASGQEAFRWTEGAGMVGLGGLGGVVGGIGTGAYSSEARGVSADGSAVVGLAVNVSGAFEAFRWTEEDGMVGLGDLAGGTFYSGARATSGDGSTVVGESTSSSGGEAFRWAVGGGMVGLGDLAGGTFSSAAFGVSADGSTVVGRGNGASGDEAFIWSEVGGMQEVDLVLSALGVDLTGWTLTEARGISGDGKTIVGYGINPSGATEGWIAVIPEPGTGLLVSLGLGVLAGHARWRRLVRERRGTRAGALPV